MKDIFISYSSQDEKIAKEIEETFSRNGWDSFIAYRDIIAGAEYAEQIVDALDQCKLVVLIMSKTANESQHVMREVERAVSNNLPIIVYFIENVTMSKSLEYFVKTQQWIAKDSHQMERLLVGVKGILDNEQLADGVAGNNRASKKKVHVVPFVIIGVAVIAAICILVAVLKKPSQSDNPQQGTSEQLSTEANSAVGGSSQTSAGSAQVETNTQSNADDFKLGDTVTFGTYNNCAIEWRILHFNDDGTAVLISKDLLCLKPFDAAEGGKYNNYNDVDYWSYENHLVTDPALNALIRGNNDWSLSNIRTWLNATTEMVKYEDQAPTKKAVCEGDDFYDTEPGFLFTWTEEERALLQLTTLKTPANQLATNADEEGFITTEDLVYFLSAEDLHWFDEAGFFFYAAPTEAAVAQTTAPQYITSDIEYYDTDTIEWWLRDPILDLDYGAGTYVYKVPRKNLPTGDALVTDHTSAAASYTGVRPAVTVNVEDLAAFLNH